MPLQETPHGVPRGRLYIGGALRSAVIFRCDVQLLELLLEALAVEAEAAGGLGDVAAVGGEGLGEDGALEAIDQFFLGGLEIVSGLPVETPAVGRLLSAPDFLG